MIQEYSQIVYDIAWLRKRRELEKFVADLSNRIEKDSRFDPCIEFYTDNEHMVFTSEIDEAFLAESFAAWLRSRY